MNQPPINLLPESIRKECLAGVRTGQYVMALALAIVFLVIGITHLRLEHQRVSEQFAETEAQADFVLRMEAEAAELVRRLGEINDFIVMQQQIAWPMEISALLATAVNQLPESVTIDRMDLDAGLRRSGRSPRTRGDDETTRNRILHGEMAGFAASDEQIAELVHQLQATAPFHNVTLDFSRSRNIWGVAAREFRLSFRIDMNQQYEVEHLTLTHGKEDEDAHR